MPARFSEKTEIKSLDQLGDTQKQQLILAGLHYDGQELTAEERLSDDPDLEECSFLGFCDYYQVKDGDEVLYDAWITMVDSGSIYKAGTTELVAEIIQFGLQPHDDDAEAHLGPAMVEARLLPKGDMSYARYKKILDAQGG